VAIVASALPAGGCFVYRAAEPARVQPGEGVRIVLSSTGSQELTGQVGPRVTRLEGRVIGSRDTALALSVTQLVRTPASEEFWNGDSVVVPVRAVDALSVRRLDRRKSAIAVGGTLVALYFMRRLADEAGVFGSRQNRPPGQQ
jgi:hypothetical protein